MIEIWKDIPNLENYQASSYGRIKSKAKNLVLSERLDRYGYFQIRLSINGNKKLYLIHRLVAFAFIENVNNKPQINHKNRIKTDNRIENLEWVTNEENYQHYLDSINKK